ncbi:PREDICTED: GDSL [Prunus dulcis]|uniref:PREDICTED: GDSL n=1 Tax=Prunus dulcis TaxID=3755 RepID=A0A5E4F527_PRUDU|nr:GDSL esterase/lipase At5g55050-like [Prunus dulcis]VVA22812.1 PREDICTED: GDSL [Prunus dulcis]
MASNFFLLLLRLFSFFFFSTFRGFTLRVAEARVVPAMYVFGDSLVDVGNNNYLQFSFAKANFPHNGIDFPTKTPTGRFCNGKNAADLLAEIMGLPAIPPYLSMASKSNNITLFLNGVNFASGAAKIFKDTNQQHPQSISFGEQVDYYLAVQKEVVQKLGASKAQTHLSKSLFTIVIGSNDIYTYFGSSINNRTSPQQYVNSMAAALKQQVKRLYDYGGRKFVIVGVALVGCTPYERNEQTNKECNADVNQMAAKYNGVLVSMLKNLKSELKGINYSYFDGYSVMHNFIQKPAAYGFAEVKAACCGLGKLNADAPCLPFATYCSNRSDHLFWDRTHPTEAAHRIFVDRILYGPLQYTFPINVQKLVAV